MSRLPKIAVTSGDPSGIGPEICLALLQNEALRDICIPMVFGDAVIFDRTADQLKIPIDHINRVGINDFKSEKISAATIVDFATVGIENVRTGKVSAAAGDAAFSYINKAIELHLEGAVDAITTGPINKLALHAAGHNFPGHTEIFAARTKTPNFCMMQYSHEVTCSFVTTHVGYAEVPGLLSIERIFEVIQLSARALRRITNKEPELVVCGLNPHAGEAGLFGNREEEQFIVPAINRARESGINVAGPFPPDTCFIPARRATTDCFVCMYHDQGHIPLKALAFDQAVNLTLGLPIVRTSVDHGTAFDIAGTNQANPSSLIEAVKLAAKLAGEPGGNKPHFRNRTVIEPVS